MKLNVLKWLFAALSILALTAEVISRGGVLTDLFLIWPAIALYSAGIKTAVVDSAHGPPFLTVAGIILLYVLPTIGLFWLARKRAGAR